MKIMCTDANYIPKALPESEKSKNPATTRITPSTTVQIRRSTILLPCVVVGSDSVEFDCQTGAENREKPVKSCSSYHVAKFVMLSKQSGAPPGYHPIFIMLHFLYMQYSQSDTTS
jgi:hypothetical protein